ncbi:MAG: hypothetical protein IT223_11675 [Crocinitomicaceae bacterium]|nr:hypothetical protein [Crocinitomicaceae bacterium]
MNTMNKTNRLFSTVAMLVAAILFASIQSFAQCKPKIKIDGQSTGVSQTDEFGLRLPLWLKENQSLAIGSSVSSISVLEFDVNGSALEFIQVLSITSITGVQVPTGKVWKVESVVMENSPSTYRSITYSIPGTYTWTVPACAEEICVELWGGGGGGSGSYVSAGSAAGGGGGGFGSGCFSVTPGASYSVTVGDGGTGGSTASAGGTGGASSVGSLISANGGNGGLASATGGTGGTGGTSSAATNVTGGPGTGGGPDCGSISGMGGTGANGGAGGVGVGSGTNGNPGTAPAGGGGGGGSGTCSGSRSGGKGGAGRVVITW